MSRSKELFSAKFFTQRKKCVEFAAINQHGFLVRYAVSEEKPLFGSYKTPEQFLAVYSKIPPEQKTFYELVPSKCSFVISLDTTTDAVSSPKEFLAKFIRTIKNLFAKWNEKLSDEQFVINDHCRRKKVEFIL